MVIVKKKTYLLGVSETLSTVDIQALVSLVKVRNPGQKKGLAGRGAVQTIVFENGTRGIAKQYRRGGLVRHFIKEYYFRIGKSRCEIECQMLEAARKYGVSVPEPLAWVTVGALYYKGWLVTKEIQNSISLVDYRAENPDSHDQILGETIRQIRMLIEHRILHVDLHPGNVLVSNNQVYIIDFDKAAFKDWDAERLRTFYLQRWQRAVTRHGLDEYLADYISENL